MATKDEKKHMWRVADIGCIACCISGYPGAPAELHHIRETAGIGQRASNYEVIPLCYNHHRGNHPLIPSIHMQRRTFIQQYGSEGDLLQLVQEKLGIKRSDHGQN